VKENIVFGDEIETVRKRDENMFSCYASEFIDHRIEAFQMLEYFGTDDEITLIISETGELVFFEVDGMIGCPIEVDAYHFGSDNMFECIIIATDIEYAVRFTDIFFETLGYEGSPLFSIGEVSVIF
jgi:hypothetical protein